ncbi:MAG: sigma-70 family RNA polymerase sigma factor [Coleofasciculaceae cyanobacterium SM2_3_26]|nr:sigma-70 family RNA polymerase sigma factor [Coleofasciculaceae cyanobacterium SM2_3_26]
MVFASDVQFPDSLSDGNLVKQCQHGDRQSFRHLYRRHQKKVRSLLYQLCGESALDDLVQEVFLRAWKGLPHLRQSATFATWLYRITWNVASDRRRELALARDRQEVLTVEPASADRALMHLHYQDLVQKGLQMLSLSHRAVLVLHDLEDVPQKDIARILEVPVGTVKSRLFHARQTMRQFLQEEGVQL